MQQSFTKDDGAKMKPQLLSMLTNEELKQYINQLETSAAQPDNRLEDVAMWRWEAKEAREILRNRPVNYMVNGDEPAAPTEPELRRTAIGWMQKQYDGTWLPSAPSKSSAPTSRGQLDLSEAAQAQMRIQESVMNNQAAPTVTYKVFEVAQRNAIQVPTQGYFVVKTTDGELRFKDGKLVGAEVQGCQGSFNV